MIKENGENVKIKSDVLDDEAALNRWLKQNSRQNVEQKHRQNKKLTTKQKELLDKLKAPGDYVETGKKTN